MQLGQETEYSVKNAIQIGYANIGDEIVLKNVDDIFS